MCNLYSMTRAPEAVRRLFRISGNRTADFEPTDEIFPGYEAPVVRTAEDGERELVVMRWGFVLLQAGKAPRRVTNMRDDKILSMAFWRGSFEERRSRRYPDCLCLHDDRAECSYGEHQSRAHAGASVDRRAVRDLA